MHILSLTGEFVHPATESAFLEHQLARTRSLLGFTLLFCTVFYLCFFVTDVAALGMDAALAATFPARLLVAVTAGSCAWLAYRRPHSMSSCAMAWAGRSALAARRYNHVSREEFRLQSSLKEAAERDHLTGCYNRRYLHEHLLGLELSRARRFGRPLTVVLCDIDNFKLINDNFGHTKGDEVIKGFAELLARATRDQVDTVVRYGGEEFLLILPETDLDGGERLAERLRAAFAADSRLLGDNPLGLGTTASFGVACFDFANSQVSYTLPDLISAADKLMYEAKRSGRNRVESIELR